jgi:Pentapeptide repeats (8 copies)
MKRIMLQLEAGPEILFVCLERSGVAGWNKFIESLFSRNICCSTWGNRKRPPPISASLNFAGADLSGRNLDSIDFRFPWLLKANLSDCSLRGAQLASIRDACLRNCDLRDARFYFADLTGVDFSGARVQGAEFVECSYNKDKPPIGLPERILARCKAETGELEEQPADQASAELYIDGTLILV